MEVTSPRRPRGVIPWHRRLEARVLFGVTLVAGLSLIAIALVTGRVVRSHTFERARTDVNTARVAFDTLIDERASFYEKQSRFITTLPVFRAYMQSPEVAADGATMATMASDYCGNLEAAFCVVTSADGTWLAAPAAPRSQASVAIVDTLIKSALANRPEHHTVVLDGSLYHVVAQPAQFGTEVLGSFVAAYRLDDGLARNLAGITRSHISLIVGNTIRGSSLTGAPRAALERALRAAGPGLASDVTLRLADEQYVGGTFDLGQDAVADARVLLLEDMAPTEGFIDGTVRQLSWAGAIVFLAAVVLSTILSRRMSRPLREIAEKAGDIAAGEWDSRLSVRGIAEAVVMAEAFNEMTDGLRHWHTQAQDRTRQLQAAYDRYAAVTNSAPDAIISADAAGVIVFWNRSAASTFGCPEPEALGRALTSWFDEGSGASAAIAAVMTAGDPSPRTFEATGRRTDGTSFPCELTVAAWTSNGAGWLTAIVRDISERRRAEEMLQQRDAQLRQSQKMEAIGRLASGVAHDFNNALAVIQGYTEEIIDALGESHAHREDLREVLKASQSAASLTRQLLAFSRKQAIDPQVVSLSEIVDNVHRMIARLTGDQIELGVSLADDDLVYADRGQIEQVIVNLCVNARDAIAERGRVDVSITRTTLADPFHCERLGVPCGDYVTLSVADTGHGMDASTAAQIFEPFFTTKEAGKGTGLGLATVYGIVRQSGGGIDLDTSPGRGTAFRVHLPVARESVDVQSTEGVEEPTPAAGTILLVEDERSLRTILRRLLETAGYAVLEAESGDAALMLARAHRANIDVLLTDVMMPGMDGVLLSQTMAAERPGVRVVFMSGHAADSFARHGLDPAAARFLQKPFSTDVLCRELRDVLAA
jgi:PAS domain S-box-containing protein